MKQNNLETIEPRTDKKTIDVEDMVTERLKGEKSPEVGLVRGAEVLEENLSSDSEEVLNQQIDFSNH